MTLRFAIALVGFCATAQESPPLYRTGVSLARVDVEVIESGKPLDGLAASDFELREDGETRPIGQLAVEQEGLDLLLVLDVSGSMAPHLEALLRGSRAALSHLRPGDRVGVATFHEDWRMRLKLTDDLRAPETEIEGVLRKEKFRGGTNTYDAVRQSARYMQRNARRDRRRAVIMMTDNLSRPSLSYEKVLSEVLEAEVLFGVLLLPVPWMQGDAAAPSENSADVTPFARATAGDIVRGPAVGAAFTEMVQRLRRRYALYFRPRRGEAGQSRQIEVTLSNRARGLHPSAEVRARREYTLSAAVLD